MSRMMLAALLFIVTGQVHAEVDAAKALSIAGQNSCLACHAVDHKVVGPAYRDIAAKYQGNRTAMAVLMKKVKNGGSGVWGDVAMPPNPGISDADLKIVLTWILAGAPKP